jgi:hypothetical protein
MPPEHFKEERNENEGKEKKLKMCSRKVFKLLTCDFYFTLQFLWGRREKRTKATEFSLLVLCKFFFSSFRATTFASLIRIIA